MGYEFADWFVDLLKVVMGPLTGAFAGAWAAQRIARRNSDIQRDLQEARATNLAASAASAVVNTVATLKKQFVAPMKTAYDALLARRTRELTAGAERFAFEADLQAMLPIVTGLPMLEKLIYERISLPGGGMGLYSHLAQALGNLKEAMDFRNDLIEEFRSRKGRTSIEMAELYFGDRDETGHTDTRFRDNVAAISLYTDDSILFGVLLSNELMKHSQGLCKTKTKGFPSPVRLDFQRLAELDLLPPIGELEAELLKSLQIDPALPRKLAAKA